MRSTLLAILFALIKVKRLDLPIPKSRQASFTRINSGVGWGAADAARFCERCFARSFISGECVLCTLPHKGANFTLFLRPPLFSNPKVDSSPACGKRLLLA